MLDNLGRYSDIPPAHPAWSGWLPSTGGAGYYKTPWVGVVRGHKIQISEIILLYKGVRDVMPTK